ncbi:hypothetical protein [Ferrimicrobium sp.]|uniref:hypothetical protein n=1 Tax=Ferrimicrobium sp. TaxID=2926050 RepID=UPI00261421E9|nr:hypothetical protein [Ferrimicrobium sp.]
MTQNTHPDRGTTSAPSNALALRKVDARAWRSRISERPRKSSSSNAATAPITDEIDFALLSREFEALAHTPSCLTSLAQWIAATELAPQHPIDHQGDGWTAN